MRDGEAWTHDVLAELKADRYRPAAWIRFLACSHARAGERRAERRREHRAVAALGIGGVAAWTLAAAAGRPQLAAVGAAWWMAQALMLDWHLGMLERPDGSRLDGLGLANMLTLVRGGLTPALFALAGTTTGLVLLCLVAAGDVLDGRIARARREVSHLGIWLDGAVDGLTIGAAALGAAFRGLLPAWAVGLVLARLVLPWLLAAAAYFGRASRPPRNGFAETRMPALAAGVVTFAGLVLAFGSWPGAVALTVGGGIAALAALALSVRRTLAAAA